MARRFATRIGAIRTNRFAQIGSQKSPYFRNARVIRANRLKPAIRNFLCLKTRFAKRGSVREPSEDSLELGHLSMPILAKEMRECFANVKVRA